jgi:CubicO group peptidase (beta-lactamase class C family)
VLDMPGKGSSAGGGYSTVQDLLSFRHCLLNHQLLSAELTDVLLEGKVEMTEFGTGVNYGYGFIERNTSDYHIVGHSGGAPGICANLDIFLDLEYTVVILSNSDDCMQFRTYIRLKLTE